MAESDIFNLLKKSETPSMEKRVSLLAFCTLSFFIHEPQVYLKNWFLAGSFASLILVKISVVDSEAHLLAATIGNLALVGILEVVLNMVW